MLNSIDFLDYVVVVVVHQHFLQKIYQERLGDLTVGASRDTLLYQLVW